MTPTYQAHGIHTGSGAGQYGYDCDKCHDGYQKATTVVEGTHVDGATDTDDVRFDTAAQPANPNGVYTDATKICATSYCHGMEPGARLLSGGTNQVPTTVVDWDAGTGGECGNCHGADNSPAVPTVTTEPTTPSANDAHGKHAGSGAGESNIACSICHANVTAVATHVNGLADVDFDETTRTWLSDARYNTFAAFGSDINQTFYNCTTVYCHSTVQGQTDATISAAPAYDTVMWDSTAVGCGAGTLDWCHGGDDAAATKMTSGSHARHISALPGGVNYDCATAIPALARGRRRTRITASTSTSIKTLGAVSVDGAYSGLSTPGTHTAPARMVYCHGGHHRRTAVGATVAGPSWNNADGNWPAATRPAATTATASRRTTGSHILHANSPAETAPDGGATRPALRRQVRPVPLHYRIGSDHLDRRERGEPRERCRGDPGLLHRRGARLLLLRGRRPDLSLRGCGHQLDDRRDARLLRATATPTPGTLGPLPAYVGTPGNGTAGSHPTHISLLQDVHR